MHGAVPIRVPADSAKVGSTFLQCLFDQQDTILFRPIETWTENGRKRSRVDYKRTWYRDASPALLDITLLQLLDFAEQGYLNLFFGVCPRLGGKGRFDLAWQIRTVRTLWTDIDHVTVDEALCRVEKSGLPPPSIVVNSGNGVHLYWLLADPHLIDDVGDPPPVEIDWIEENGRKKPRKYIVEDGERIYLDKRKTIRGLSPKAKLVQDTLAGIAEVIGGDHTTDLSRLLRIPGTFNRKDQRNGKESVPTELVSCDPTIRYPFSAFDRWRAQSPENKREEQIAHMPLPKPRKLTATKEDKLADLIAASQIAQPGSRSEADFAVCCFALRHGIAKDELWKRVANVGKFAEQGEQYFDRTWENAEQEVRAHKLEEIQKSAGTRPNSSSPNEGTSDDEQGTDGKTIHISKAGMPVRNTLAQVTDVLIATDNCFSRAEQLVVINDPQIRPIFKPAELQGLLSEHVEIFVIDDGENGEFKPLPTAYANTWLNNYTQRGRLPIIKLFTRNPVYTDDWRLVGPGFDESSGIYYAGNKITGSTATTCLNRLLAEFCFQTPGDRTNYLGILLTTILMSRFIGSKPAVLFNGNQPGLGKSILAQVIAILRDGQTTETASYNPNDEEFEKRLGAIVRRGATTIIIDNAKTRGRNQAIESACLERSITDPILSYRFLGQSESIRAENSHIFCITANAPDVSRDLVTRSVVINLYYEGNPSRRRFSIPDPESFAITHRDDLLGELIGMVERWKECGMPQAAVDTRFNKRGWGNLIGGILQVNGEPDFLANAESAAIALDETRREFGELIDILTKSPKGMWYPNDLVSICTENGLLIKDFGEGTPRSKTTRMGHIASRFIDDRFAVCGDREAVFQRLKDRKGNYYQILVNDKCEHGS